MKTPIVDFVRKYSESQALRLHMPGHKGVGHLGFEGLDITEIDGADSLYEAKGIIRESERNASALFGCETYYSTEGSSHCIRTMIYLLTLYAKESARTPLILAARNVHKTFISACGMLDVDVSWIYPEKNEAYLSCKITPKKLEEAILSAPERPIALYLTSPDYLGNVADIKALSEVCHRYGVLVCVDNAHGAYLRFLPNSLHPMDLGADICSDSAHKTLPVLTGGAYIHISRNAPNSFFENVRNCFAAFGSTSPSYLILQSLDAANKYISEGYPDKLHMFSLLIEHAKKELSDYGYVFVGDESLKLTLKTKPVGYTGEQIADILKQKGITVEFCDSDHVVMMLTPETGEAGLDALQKALLEIPINEPVTENFPRSTKPKAVMSIREAMLRPSQTLPASECLGMTLAMTAIACPPAVPIVVSGEMIDLNAIKAFEYYGITHCNVIK